MTRMAGSIKGLGSFLGTRPDYAAQGSQSVLDKAREVASVAQSNALVTNAGLKAQADIASAQHYADAAAAGAQAQSQASMVGGIASGLGGLASGIGKLGGGGGGSFGSIGRSIGGTPYKGAFTPGGSWGSF